MCVCCESERYCLFKLYQKKKFIRQKKKKSNFLSKQKKQQKKIKKTRKDFHTVLQEKKTQE